MLKSLHLSNFRCFDEHKVNLRPMAVMVGRNNAGKSTLVEALKLVAISAARYRRLPYHHPPAWTDLPYGDVGISPSLEGFDLGDASVFHAYHDPPAVIRATFSKGQSIDVHLGPDSQVHVVVRRRDHSPITSKSEAAQLRLPTLSFLPPVGPLRTKEKLLTWNHVRSSINTDETRSQIVTLPATRTRLRRALIATRVKSSRGHGPP